MGYDYKRCVLEIDEFAANNPDAGVFSVGESVMERRIYCISYGIGAKKLFVNGAHHGLEYITSAFLMRFLREYSRCLCEGYDMYGYDVRRLYRDVTLYVMPMVNPDGVDIAINGIDLRNIYHRRLLSVVGIHRFNHVWQANANGVDINHNYDAGWEMVKKAPAPSKYAGPYAESEPETRAVCDFVRAEMPDMLIAFHAQGGEIYYDFDGMASKSDYKTAQKMAIESGYPVRTPEGSAAFGGCKDWFIKEFGRSGYTVEMGRGKNPLPEERLADFYEDNAKIILCAMRELRRS